MAKPKKNLLLVHGSPGQANSWRPVTKYLDPVWAPYMPTMQGNDGSEPPKDMEIGDIAERVVRSLPEGDAPVFLAGHSFGGSVCLEIALSCQLSISGMVLFEPVPLDFLRLAGKNNFHRQSSDYFAAYANDFDSGNRLAVRSMIDYWFGEDAFDAMPEGVREYLIGATATNVRDVRCGMRRRYEPDELAELSMPVSIVYGNAGPDITRQIAESIAVCVPNGKEIVLEGGNHAMLAEHPKHVADFINQMNF